MTNFRFAAVMAAAISFVACPAGAAEPLLLSLPTAATGTMPTITVDRKVSLSLPIRNDTADARTLDVEAIIARPDGGYVADVRLSGATVKSGAVTLQPREPLDLKIDALLPVPGDHVLMVRIVDRAKADAPVSFPFRLSWPQASADALDALVTPAASIAGKVGEKVSPTFVVDAPATHALSLLPPSLRTVERAIPGGYAATSLRGKVTGCDAKEISKVVEVPAATTSCFALAVDPVTAGSYRARVRLADAGGGSKLIDLTFTAKEPLWYAALMLGIGALAGLLIAAWQGVGRDRFVATEAALVAEEALLRLVQRARSLAAQPNALGGLVGLAADNVEAARRGAAVQTESLVARTRQLATWAAEWQRAAVLPLGERPAAETNAALTALDAALDTDAQPALDALTAAVTSALANHAAPAAAAAAAAAGQTGLTADWLADFIRPSRSLTKLRRQRGRWELIVQLLLFGLFALVVFDQLYIANPSWGDWGDVILMILVGATAFGGISATVAGFRQIATRPA